MSINHRSNQYKQTSIKTANRGQILLMLYEAAIRNAKLAIICLEKKDTAGKGHHIGKIHDIVNELTNTLDFEVGGEIARQLEGLYNFITGQLLKANMENSVEVLQSVLKVLETLHSGWKVAVEQFQKEMAKPL